MKVQFSSDLIKYLAMYLNISVADIANDPNFTFSKIYLYKIVHNDYPVSNSVNETLNDFWKARELTEEDLNKIYSLMDILESGAKKQRQHELKKYRKFGVNKYNQV